MVRAGGDHTQHRLARTWGTEKEKATGVCLGEWEENCHSRDLRQASCVWNSEDTLFSIRPGRFARRRVFHYSGICSGTDGFQNQYEVGKERNFQKAGMVGRHRATGVDSSVYTVWSVGGSQDAASA